MNSETHLPSYIALCLSLLFLLFCFSLVSQKTENGNVQETKEVRNKSLIYKSIPPTIFVRFNHDVYNFTGVIQCNTCFAVYHGRHDNYFYCPSCGEVNRNYSVAGKWDETNKKWILKEK